LVGDVTAAYVIDGEEIARQRYEADTNSQQSIDGVQTNFPLFRKGGLTSQLHNVKVTIISCTNQRFSLDYITYTPSFTVGKDAPTATASSQVENNSHKLPVGAIVGIVVGGVGLIIIAIFMLWLYRKRRRSPTSPFPASSSTTAITRKEEVPPHMRQLRSHASQDTVDLTDGTSAGETWVVAPHLSDTRNIDALLSAVPPPAYLNHDTILNVTDNTTETTTHPTFRSPS
jgi:hypothetical protein